MYVCMYVWLCAAGMKFADFVLRLGQCIIRIGRSLFV